MTITIESMPSWLSDLWAAAKTAGPFGNLLLLVIVGILWRTLKRAQEDLLELTVAGLKAMNGIEAALLGLQGKKPKRSRRSRSKRQ